MFVSFDSRGFNKAAGGENKTGHRGPHLTLENTTMAVMLSERNIG